MLQFIHNGNPHEMMRTTGCKSLINELSLIWHISTKYTFYEMTRLILLFLFTIHISTLTTKRKFSHFPLKINFFFALIINSTIISFHMKSLFPTRQRKTFFYDSE